MYCTISYMQVCEGVRERARARARARARVCVCGEDKKSTMNNTSLRRIFPCIRGPRFLLLQTTFEVTNEVATVGRRLRHLLLVGDSELLPCVCVYVCVCSWRICVLSMQGRMTLLCKRKPQPLRVVLYVRKSTTIIFMHNT